MKTALLALGLLLVRQAAAETLHVPLISLPKKIVPAKILEVNERAFALGRGAVSNEEVGP